MEAADADGEQSDGDLQSAREAYDEKHVEPSRHEREVNSAADQNEYARDQEDAPSVAQVNQQREQKEQHPHGAWVESVDQTDGECEQRQAEPIGVDVSQPADLQASAWQARGREVCLVDSEQVLNLGAGRLGRVEPHQEPITDQERGYARLFNAVAAVEGDEAREDIGRSGDLQCVDLDLRLIAHEFLEKGEGAIAVRTPRAMEDLDRRARRSRSGGRRVAPRLRVCAREADQEQKRTEPCETSALHWWSLAGGRRAA